MTIQTGKSDFIKLKQNLSNFNVFDILFHIEFYNKLSGEAARQRSSEER